MASGFPIIKFLWLVGLTRDQQSSIPRRCEPLTFLLAGGEAIVSRATADYTFFLFDLASYKVRHLCSNIGERSCLRKFHRYVQFWSPNIDSLLKQWVVEMK
jgi:hypothetical protein